MLSVLNRHVFSKTSFRYFARCASSDQQSFSMAKVKAPPVPDIVRKPPRVPFLKSLYAGQYDVEVLTYPETLNLERHKDLESRLQLVQNNCTQTSNVQQLGLFSMNIPYHSSGLNLTVTEMSRIFEHFDSSVFKSVFEHTISVDIIKTFGTPQQKSKYLPLFASGAVCSFHETVKASALPNQSWELNGSVNNSVSTFMLIVDGSNAFIVEKDQTTVTGNNLHLKQLNVLKENTIENIEIKNILNNGKLYKCCGLIKSLKSILQITVENVIKKERLGDKLRHYDSVIKTLSKALINIYTIESMIYLTTWMIDGFDNADVELEVASTEMYTRQAVTTTLRDLKSLYGRGSINEPFLSKYNDVDNLLVNLTNNIELSEFIGSCGVDYLNKFGCESNTSFLVSAFRKYKMKRDDPSLILGLQQYLHPALMHTADFAEYCVLKFQYGLEMSKTNGHLSIDNKILMELLSKTTMHIYAMTAVLGRASRSYCTGIRYSDLEMTIAEIVVRESYATLKPILEDVISGSYVADSSVYQSFAEKLLNR
ncbi:uncharacterized protein LOC126840217 [Adelges cooleyi]|uniref:uncharacterized protein LOC126840217 n=1 Tax=Adelges cooleyi TaxID=133065 RepID=UPI00217F4688|nr:uncharacterized protein LOC126840217 [Adelges cooleyi]